MEVENKQWWKSKTLHGLAVTVIGAALALFKVDLGGEAVVNELASGLLVLAGSIWTFIGRKKAKVPLK